MDQRAQAHGLIAFVAMLTTGALLFILMQPAVNETLTMLLDQTSHQAARDQINERQTIFSNILFYVLFVSGVFLIARAVLQSRSPG